MRQPLCHRHPRYRGLTPGRTLKAFDAHPNADPHFNGTLWDTFLWRLRLILTEEGWTGVEVYQVIVQTLFRIEQLGMANPTHDPAPH